MKLILAIVPNREAGDVIQALIAAQFQVTRFASTGGFLRRGNVTLLIGTEDDKVDDALVVIKRVREGRAAGRQGEGGTALVLNVSRLVRVDGGSGVSPVQ